MAATRPTSKYARTVAARRAALKDGIASVTSRLNIFAALERPDETALAMAREILDLLESATTRTIRSARNRAFSGFSGGRLSLSDEIRGTIDGAVDQFGLELHDKILGYLSEIRANLERDVARGASVEKIMGNLDTERAAKKFRDALSSIASRDANGIIQQVDSLVYTDAIAEREITGSTRGAYVWVTSGGSIVCEDCEPRDGKTQTLAEWESDGMPGSTVLLCSSFGVIQCQCSLEPAG